MNLDETQRTRLAEWFARTPYERAATAAEVFPVLEHLVGLWLEAQPAEPRESMTLARFAQVVHATDVLLRKAIRRNPGGYDIEPKRCPGLESAPAHLAWMLDEAMVFYADGRIQKANRWIGYVQGSMHADGYATVEELKRANMPEGEAFEEGKT